MFGELHRGHRRDPECNKDDDDDDNAAATAVAEEELFTSWPTDGFVDVLLFFVTTPPAVTSSIIFANSLWATK